MDSFGLSGVRLVVEISSLTNHPSAIGTIANWYHEAWGREDGISLEVLHRSLTQSFAGESFPYTYLAFSDGQLVGSAQLKLQEMKEFPELSHWLGSVYVAASARGSGVAQALVSHVASEAEHRGVENLYLQTEDLSGGLYSRCGWGALTQTQSHGKEVLIMERRLSPNNFLRPTSLGCGA